MNDIRRVTKNVVALFTTSAGRLLLGMVLQLYVAQRLGVSGLGKYAVVLAFVAVFQVMTELGLSRLVIRELARGREPQRYFYGAVVVELIGAVLSYGLLIVAVQLLDYKQDTGRALYLAGLSLFPYAITSACQACFQATERMELITAVESGGAAFQLVLAIALLSAGHGVVALGGVLVAGEALVALLSLLVAYRMRILTPVRLDLRFSWQLARSAPPFFLLAMSVVVYSRLDVIMISRFLGERSAGIYSAAYLIVRALSLGITAYSDALYPALSRLQADAAMRDRLTLAGRKALQYGFVLIFPLAAGGAALAPELIHALYRNQQYAGSVIVLRLVIWESIPFLANAILSRLLIAHNLQRLSAQVAAIKLAAAVACYGILIPLLGLPGAAIATVLATATGTGLNLRFADRHVLSLHLGRLSWKPALATIAMAAALLLFPTRGLWILIPCGAAIYVGLLFGLRTLVAEDWQILSRLLRPRSIG